MPRTILGFFLFVLSGAVWPCLAQDIPTDLEACRERHSDGRPGSFPDYRDGYRAIKTDAWQEAATAMWWSLCTWPEDGEQVRVYGRWNLPYLPHYYLGVALYEMGCYRAARFSLESSILMDVSVYRGQDQQDHLKELLSILSTREDDDPDLEVLCLTWLERLEPAPSGTHGGSL